MYSDWLDQAGYVVIDVDRIIEFFKGRPFEIKIIALGKDGLREMENINDDDMR